MIGLDTKSVIELAAPVIVTSNVDQLIDGLSAKEYKFDLVIRLLFNCDDQRIFVSCRQNKLLVNAEYSVQRVVDTKHIS